MGPGTVRLAAAGLVTLAAATACGETGPTGEEASSARRSDDATVAVSDARVRLPANPDVTAGYLTISNGGDTAETLRGVRTDVAESVEIHRTVHEDGTVRMEPRPELEIGVGETVELTTGGTHLMLMEPTNLEAGRRVELVLRFANAGEVTTRARVVDPARRSPENPE